jgi:hypothetical protein
MEVEFRAELYNLFNHANWYLPSSRPARREEARRRAGSSRAPSRLVQFALRLIF